MLVILAACKSETTTVSSRPTRTNLRRLPTLIAEDAPPCDFAEWAPYYNTYALCAETVFDSVSPPEAAPALTSITFAADGTLYIARTAFGEIWAIRDTNGDQFMDEPTRVAGGLTLPTGIAAWQGALYVVSMDGLLRLDDADGDGIWGASTVLVDDLPGAQDGTFRAWPGSVGISPDGRLVVSIRSASSREAESAPTGLLVSYAPDGSDEQIIATGLHNPVDFAWHPDTGDLWIVDSGASVARLNRIQPGEDDSARSPEFILDGAQNSPAGLVFYASEAIPFWTGALLVAERGSWNLPEPVGYAVIVVPFDADHNPTRPLDRVAPRESFRNVEMPVKNLSLLGHGFFPYHPVDVAVSPEGWIYVALEEGRILRFRPRPKANKPIPVYLTAHPR